MFMFQLEFMVHWRPLVVILRNNRRLLQVGIDLIQTESRYGKEAVIDRLVVFSMALL